MLPQHMGAYTNLFAAASPAVRERRSQFAGAYLVPVGVIQAPREPGEDPTAAKDLWETSERAVAALQ